MKINLHLGIVHDSVFYNVIFFNPKNVLTFLQVYAEKESDIFENYHEFVKKYNIEPPENLYPFFYFDSRVPCVMREYFDKYFDVIDGTVASFLKLLQDKNKFKRYVYHYYLEPLKKDVDVQAVLVGDDVNTSLAVALLSAIHTDYPRQIHNLFYRFDELVDELVLHMKNTAQRVTLYHNKKKSLFEGIVNNFLSSEHINIINKNYFKDEKIDFTKQPYSISLFNRQLIQVYPKQNEQWAILIGDKSHYISTLYSNYNHVTALSSASIIANEVMRDILYILIKGEKSITQLSFLLNYSRPTIDKFITIMYDELVIKISRKSGNEVFYKINNPYFVSAKIELNKAIDDILHKTA